MQYSQKIVDKKTMNILQQNNNIYLTWHTELLNRQHNAMLKHEIYFKEKYL